MNKPIFVYEAPLFVRAGYGGLSEDIAKSFLRYDKFDKFDLHIVPTQWGACSKKNMQEDVKNDPETQYLVSRILRTQLPRQPEIYCKVSIPSEFQPHGKYNIGITAGIESTLTPATWLEGLNRMDLNLATSKFNKDIFSSTSYTKNHQDGRKEEIKLVKPCEVVFWGANTTVFQKTNEKVETLDQKLSVIPEQFAFLFVGQWTHNSLVADRKNIGTLVKTFLETFRGVTNPPCLILKTNGAAICKMDKYECIAKLKSVYDMVGGDKLPNVYILHGELTDQEMNALYNHEKVKVHISFTHGEGFGHPLLLSTLSGKPLLVSNWSGHLDFLNPDYCKLLHGDLAAIPPEAVNEWFMKEAGWFNVNTSAASEIMRNVVHHYGGYLAKAEKLRLENEVKFNLAAMDKVFHSVLDQYLPKFAVEQKIVLPKLKKLEMPKLVKPQ